MEDMLAQLEKVKKECGVDAQMEKKKNNESSWRSSKGQSVPPSLFVVVDNNNKESVLSVLHFDVEEVYRIHWTPTIMQLSCTSSLGVVGA